MIRAWDYLMRRKVLLLVALIAFFSGAFLSYQFLQNTLINHAPEKPQYISINSWNTDVEIPHTGGPAANFSVMSPHDLAIWVQNDQAAEENQSTDVEPPAKDSTANDQVAEVSPSETQPTETKMITLENENLDHLEEVKMPDPAVMEVRPGSAQTSDETLGYSVDALGDVNNQDLPTASEVSAGEILHVCGLAVMELIVLSLGTYLTYWHFRR